MSTRTSEDKTVLLHRAEPSLHQQADETQAFRQLIKLPIALSENACRVGVENLNQLLADVITLRDLYKTHHWQVSGPTFYQLQLLFDKHYEQQVWFVAEHVVDTPLVRAE